MELCIEYDKALTLKSYTKGDALSSLTCTPSGSLGTYPFKFVWDGMADDASNGTLAVLTFDVPYDAGGSYEIKAYVEDGSVYNDNDDDVDVSVIGGRVSVISETPAPTPRVTVSSGGSGRTVARADNTSDKVYSYMISIPDDITITPDDITVKIGGVTATKHKGLTEKLGAMTGSGNIEFTAAITNIPQGATVAGTKCEISISYILEGIKQTETTEFTLE